MSHRDTRVRDSLHSTQCAKQDVAVAIPSTTDGAERIAECLHGTSRTIDLLQPGIGKEGDESAVGRPERVYGVIGSGQGSQLQRIERANPDLLLRVVAPSGSKRCKLVSNQTRRRIHLPFLREPRPY